MTAEATRRGRRTTLLVATLLVLAAAFATGTAVTRAASAREEARADALVEGPALVETLLSYNSPTVDADLAAAAVVTAGDFRDGFTEYVTNTVVPQSKASGTSTRARVVESGYLSGTADHVRLLMFVDQITTSTVQPAPAATTSRVEVGLDLVDGEWRITELTPV